MAEGGRVVERVAGWVKGRVGGWVGGQFEKFELRLTQLG